MSAQDHCRNALAETLNGASPEARLTVIFRSENGFGYLGTWLDVLLLEDGAVSHLGHIVAGALRRPHNARRQGLLIDTAPDAQPADRLIDLIRDQVPGLSPRERQLLDCHLYL